MRQDARLGMSLINKRQVGLSKANDEREQHKLRESTVFLTDRGAGFSASTDNT